jgi:hypothetical protein
VLYIDSIMFKAMTKLRLIANIVSNLVLRIRRKNYLYLQINLV